MISTKTSSPRCLLAAMALLLVALPAAAQDTLVVEGGRVGINTATPGGDLHIFGSSGADVFNAIGPNAFSNALNFGYSGASFGLASGFFNVRPAAGAVSPNPALYFMTANVDRMIVDNQGFLGVHLDGSGGTIFDPVHPIEAQSTGARLTAGGAWQNGSSRELKDDIRPIGLDEALAALGELEPVEFVYKTQANDPQVGFIAEDLPDLVATPERKTLGPVEIVGVLTRVVQEQQRQIEELTARLDQLTRASAPAQ